MTQTASKPKYTAEESKAHAIKRRSEQKSAKAFLDTSLATTKSIGLYDLQARFHASQKG